jgi:cyanate permease
VASIWFPPQDLAKANGIGMSSMQLGGAIGMALAVTVLAPTFGGWRGTTVAVAVFAAIAGLLWAMFYRDRVVEGGPVEPQENMSANFKRVMKVKEVWLLAIVYGIFMIDLMAIVAHLPHTLQDKGVANAGGYVGLWLMVAVVFNVLGGVLSDMFGKRKPFIIFTAIIFGLCIPTFVLVTGPTLVATIIISGAVAGAAVPIIMTIPAEMKQVGPALAGTAMGLIFMLGNAGGFVGPVVAGIIMDVTKTPMAAFGFMAAAIIIAGLLAIPLPETGQKRQAR